MVRLCRNISGTKYYLEDNGVPMTFDPMTFDTVRDAQLMLKIVSILVPDALTTGIELEEETHDETT